MLFKNWKYIFKHTYEIIIKLRPFHILLLVSVVHVCSEVVVPAGPGLEVISNQIISVNWEQINLNSIESFLIQYIFYD